MGFMQKMRDGLARFMYGRNGADQLNRALLWVYVGLVAAGLIFSLLGLQAPFTAVNVLTYAVMILLLFRMLSKNLAKRRAENQRWVNWWWGMKSRRQGAKARRADKEHKYFTCKSCKAICRVPVGKGSIVITCPKCGAEIRGKT